MIAWLAITGTASAGFSAGVFADAAAPVSRVNYSEPGTQLGAWLGWRANVGPVHLRPEAQGLLNNAEHLGSLAVGGSVTFLGPVHVGPYVHLGVGLGGDPGPTTNLGLVAEVTPGPLLIGLRLGWERLSPHDFSTSQCLDATSCEQASANWLTAGIEVGLK